MSRLLPRTGSVSCLFLLLLLAAPTQAQEYAPGEGVVRLTDWPLSAQEAEDPAAREPWREYTLLPFLDTLTLGYRYQVVEDTPMFSFGVDWVPASSGMLDGAWVRADELPDDLLIVGLELQADVYVAGEAVADLLLAVDSLALAPAPDVFIFESLPLSWEDVFPGTTAGQARHYFAEGFALQNLRLVGVTFTTERAEETPIVQTRPQTRERRPEPPPPTVVVVERPGVGIWIDGWIHTRPRRHRGEDGPTVAERDRRSDMGRQDDRPTRRPRGGDTRSGDDESADAEEDDRAAEGLFRGRGRSSDTGKRDDDDDDDEEDDDSLLPAALMAGAAVVTLAVVGGTVGVYGNASYAPYGLSAGYVHPRGGVLLQAAVNEAVFKRSTTETEYLITKAVLFYDLFQGPLQPSVSFGAVLTDLTDKDIGVRPTLGVGLVYNQGPLVLMGGVDLETQGFEFGVAFNFRQWRR